MDKLKSADPSCGYNISPTAASCLGMKLTKEQKRKIGDTHRSKLVSKMTRKRIGDANRGRKLPPRTAKYKARLSAATKGIRKSARHKAKLSKLAKSQPRKGGRFTKGTK